MADHTLGDILGAALADPPPLSFVEQLIMQTVCEEMAREREALAQDAMVRSAWVLSGEVAPLIGSTAGEVFDVLGHVPDNLLGLLESPQGWTTLAEYVACDLRRAVPGYKPQVH